MPPLPTRRRYGLERVGGLIAPLLLNPAGWIHRRVDIVEFIDDTFVRRRVSVDFTLPPFYRQTPYQPTVPRLYLAPLALLAKDPLRHFDLEDEDGRSLPLLTREENSRVATAALVANAHAVLARHHLTLSEEVAADLRAVARGTGEQAQGALDRLLTPSGRARVSRELLSRDARLRALLGALAENFIVLAPVSGDGRRIVKYAYDEPLRNSRRPRTRRAAEALGWATKQIVWGTPSLGLSRSYHVEVEAPRDLEIVTATLVAADPRGGSYIESSGFSGRRSHLNREDLPPDAVGTASVLLRARRPGMLRAAALLGVLTAALLTLGAARAGQVARDPAAAVTLLVVVPALLAGYLARPGEHELASAILIGVRGVIVFTGLLAVAACASLIVGISHSETRVVWWALAGLGWSAAFVLLLSYLLPRVSEGAMRDT